MTVVLMSELRLESLLCMVHSTLQHNMITISQIQMCSVCI